MYKFKKISLVLLILSTKIIGACSTNISNNNCEFYPRSIYVPRQLSYNPILENALTMYKRISLECGENIFSIKPIFTKTTGDKLSRYFNRNHEPVLSVVQEDGSGDIDSLWFRVISAPGSFYSSNLSFCPERKAGGALFYFAFQLPCDWQISINTALLHASHNMYLSENVLNGLGDVEGFETMAQSFCHPNRRFGRICCGDLTETRLDDIQLKFIKQLRVSDCHYWDGYLLLSIPTGKESRAVNLFEPLVGSKHAYLGLGTDFACSLSQSECSSWSLLGEVKWRYGLSNFQIRSFDTISNGQWSRYMLVSEEPFLDRFRADFTINRLTLKADVTPRNALDVYLALHWDKNSCWQFELGYDFSYRQEEKVCLSQNNCLDDIAMADLLGIARFNPVSASTANISQGVLPGPNQMVSDIVFTPITLSNINLISGSAPRAISNSVYFSAEYLSEFFCKPTSIGLNLAYERGTTVNSPDNVFVWVNFDILF